MITGSQKLKMILLLAIMTPGIPEYLTGSSRITDLFTDQSSFLIGLALNMGIYTTGALLIREFAIKFRKGWATILALGCSYGIVEEGIAVHTFVQASGSPVGILAVYGRYAGINWVWAFGLTFFHAVFSIALPLLLLSIAYPEKQRERLIGRAGSALTATIYFLTVIVLNVILFFRYNRAFPTIADFIFFSFASLLFLVVGYLLPENAISARRRAASSNKSLYLLGFFIFPAYSFMAFVPFSGSIYRAVPPVIDILVHIILFGLLLSTILYLMPSKNNGPHKLSLAAGMITPLILFGELSEINGSVPFISIVSVIAIVMLIRLRANVKKQTIDASRLDLTA